MYKIREKLSQMVDLTTSDWQVFASKLQRQIFPKKTVFLDVGQTENYLSFIEKGAVRLFIPREDNELTFGFCFENDFVSAYDSFLLQKPCTYVLETITETTLFSISYQDLQKVYETTTVGNTIGRLAAENQFLIKFEREQAFLNQTAEERYLTIFSKRPNLLQEVPLKYLASYIGVTPQALSRIRKRIS